MAKKLQVYYDNILFDSEIEKGYYQILKEQQDKGLLSQLQVHKEYILIPPFECKNGTYSAMKYTPDFVYFDEVKKEYVAVEIKGFARPDFEIRKKLFLYQNQDIVYHLITYSKSTGYMEVADYKKARKKIVIENEIERRKKKQEERKERLQKKKQRLLSRSNKYAEKKIKGLKISEKEQLAHDRDMDEFISIKRELEKDEVWNLLCYQ